MVLVKVGEHGHNTKLASAAADFSEDQAFKGFAGNIAVTKKKPELEFPGTAKKLTEKMMAEQAQLVDETGLKAPDAEFSVVISVAGYETIHGTHPKLFPPEVTRQREKQTKENIVSVFASNGLKITEESIYGSGDQDFILQIAREVDPKPHLTQFKATYDILFLTHPSSFEPKSKWESVSEYQYTNDNYQRVKKNLPKGGTYSLGFEMADHFYSKIATSETPPPCFGNECDRKKQEHTEAAQYREDMQALYPDMTKKEIINYFQGFKRNNELGDKTLVLTKTKQQAIWQHVVIDALIKDAQPLVKAIIRQLPRLKIMLHQFQPDKDAADVIDVHVIGSGKEIYKTVSALSTFVNNQGSEHKFQLKMVPEASWPQLTADSVVQLTKRLEVTGK